MDSCIECQRIDVALFCGSLRLAFLLFAHVLFRSIIEYDSGAQGLCDFHFA